MTQKTLTQKCVRNEPMHQMSGSKTYMRGQSANGWRMISFAMTRGEAVGSTLL